MAGPCTMRGWLRTDLLPAVWPLASGDRASVWPADRAVQGALPAPDLVRRQPRAAGPNRLWVAVPGGGVGRVEPAGSRVGDAAGHWVELVVDAKVLSRCRFQTRAQARSTLFAYLEGFSNLRRRHSALGYLSPEEFESRWSTETVCAAPQPPAGSPWPRVPGPVPRHAVRGRRVPVGGGAVHPQQPCASRAVRPPGGLPVDQLPRVRPGAVGPGEPGGSRVALPRRSGRGPAARAEGVQAGWRGVPGAEGTSRRGSCDAQAAAEGCSPWAGRTFSRYRTWRHAGLS